MRVAVIDCAIQEPSYECFNQLADFLERPLTYHIPSQQGMRSLHRSFSECFIVLGSYSNLDDNLDWHKDLQDFLMNALQKQNQPVLGLCFGHQLVSNGFGADVRPGEKSFHGVRKLSLAPNLEEVHTKFEAESFLINYKQEFELIASHSQEVVTTSDFEQSTGLICAASSLHCHNDILIHRELPFVGFQGHPEASLRFIEQNVFGNQVFPTDEEIERAQSDGLNLISLFVDQAEKYSY